MSRFLRLAVAALLPLLATGCLDIEKQTVYVVTDKDRDEVHALLVYEGLRVSAPNDAALKEAKEQLSQAIDKKLITLGGWPFILDLGPEKGDNEEAKKLKELLGKHLTIENGNFFTNADGKLCAYQRVKVKDASKLVAAGNGFISQAILAEQPPEKPAANAGDKEEEELLRRAARDRHAWLKLEPGRLSLTMPATPEAARRMKRDVLGVNRLEEVLKKLDPAAAEKQALARQQVEELKAGASFLADNPFSFDQRRDRVIISLGVGDGEPIRLEMPTKQPREASKVDGELTDYARTLKVKFRKGVTTESLIEEFRKEHGGKK
jgi:hypothetical protein